jgi:hypothetical protein
VSLTSRPATAAAAVRRVQADELRRRAQAAAASGASAGMPAVDAALMPDDGPDEEVCAHNSILI